MRGLLAAILALTAVTVAFAAPPDERLDDPALEARAVALTEGLRCLVCEGQGVNDSNADFARDVRLFVRQRLVAGDTDEDVRAALRLRFGDQIFQRPPLRADTLLLWFGPPLAALGLGALVLLGRRQAAASPAAAPLSDEEKARIDEILRTDS